jgi:S-layer homology domain
MRNKNNGQRRTRYIVVVVAMLLALALGAGLLSKFSPTSTASATAAKSGPQMNAPAGAIDTSATKPDVPVTKIGNVKVIQATQADTSIPLRDMKPATGGPSQEAPENPSPSYHSWGHITDSVVQNFFGPLAMPTPILTFEGISSVTSGCGCLPPDTNGDVGPNNYVQTVNAAFQIWDKSGNSLYGPAHINTLFSGFGGPCQTQNSGDPITLYDQAADRWFIAQFTSGTPYGQCIAISATSDPTGAYHRYFFQQSTSVFYDYPHYGVWPDGYYFTANTFTGNSFTAPAFGVFERAKMLVGDTTATYQEFNPGTYFGNDLPADMDGANPPPAGSPGIFGSSAGTFSSFRIWHLHVDYPTPANSVLSGPYTVAVAPFDPDMCGGSRNCIAQPGTSAKVDAMDDRIMHRLVYRNMGSYEALLSTVRVDATGTDQAGVRWYEFHAPLSTAPTVYQQGTYAPDTDNRWMPSISMDRDGNIAVGYSVSSSATYPSIRYAGRLVSDPLGQLAQGETTLIAGTGSQTSGSGRWGDYTAMSIDPVDDCTFWYTNEYYTTTGNAPWQTRIGSFKFPGCGATTPTPTVTGTPPTATATASPTATSTPVPTICLNYAVETTVGTIVPATGDIGIHCDDCGKQIPLPFSVKSYGTSYNTLNVSSNAVLQFVSADTAYGNSCLPASVYDHAIMLYWDDLTTTAAGQGFFTATTGIAPDRIFYLEVKATSYAGGTVDAELTLHEDSNNFELTYGAITVDSSSGTIGVQGAYDGANTRYTQIICDTSGLLPGTQYNLTLADCPATATPVPTETPTVCTLSFEDVPVGSTFYPFIQCLACRGIINGYPCGGPGEPCNGNNDPYFRPGNNVTRGQFSKIASNSAGFVDPPGAQQYEDVAVGSTFFDFIWRLTDRGLVNGYPCGGVGEPCGPGNLPYFRPNANVTRGQLSKIDANAAGLTQPPGAQQYEDVLPGSTFYDFIWRLSDLGFVNGYPCGGVGEPCGPLNLPYFRPGANATRGQASKIVSNTFFPNCMIQSAK